MEPLFDAEGLVSDVELTLGDAPHVRPARVGFLAGMLAVWTLGPGVKLTERQSAVLRDVARDALERARRAV